LTVPPALRLILSRTAFRPKFLDESIGSTTPAIPETPPWLTAGMLCQKSLFVHRQFAIN